MRKCITNSNKYYRNILCFMRLCVLLANSRLAMQTLRTDRFFFAYDAFQMLRIIEHFVYSNITRSVTWWTSLCFSNEWWENKNKTRAPIEIQSGNIIFKYPLRINRNGNEKKNAHRKSYRQADEERIRTDYMYICRLNDDQSKSG